MRICILSQSRLEVIGGVESYINSLNSWLLNHKQDTIVISRGLYNVKGSLKNNKIENYRVLRVPQVIYQVGLLFSSFMAVLRILKENKVKRIDVIHSVDSGYSGLAGVIASKIIGAPLCYSIHSHRRFLLSRYFKGFSGFFLSKFDYCIERYIYSKADRLIVLDANLKDYILSYRISPKKILEIPIAIRTKSFESIPSDEMYQLQDLSKSDLVIGYVGRLEPEKNIFALLRAFKEALETKKNIFLIIIGDGSLRKSLEIYSKNNNISDKVRFLGMQRNINYWLSMINIFVLPSKTEGMSIALLEAMAAEKAIIASNIPGISRMVKHKQTALLFDPNNSDQLKNAILQLVKDQNLRYELGRGAKVDAKQYDLDTVYPKMLHLYFAVKKREIQEL
jgi:glycosyltransferase involved in cell wall biosynthesis